MFYPESAVERTMKAQEVILRAMAKKITWWQAAEIIGIRDRASHFFHTPRVGGKIDPHQLTPVGRAQNELGIQRIPSYSPQMQSQPRPAAQGRTGGGCASSARLRLAQSFANGFGDFLFHRRVEVFGSRPEKAAQTVAFAARHDVDVQMRDGLADPIVDGDEGSVGFHRRLDGAGKELHRLEKRADAFRRQIVERFDVLAGNEKQMAGKKWPVIEKRHEMRIFINNRRPKLSPDQIAELAFGRLHRRLPRRLAHPAF